MKANLVSLFLFLACAALWNSDAAAQTFTVLHAFKSPTGLSVTNGDGAAPHCVLISSSNALYGTTLNAGSSGNGTIFKVNLDGSGFTNLYTFTPTPGSFPFANRDGANPAAGLILSGNTLYGTAKAGGTNGRGTIFSVNTNGTCFTNLHNFDFTDGSQPCAGLVLSSNILYGTASEGGISGWGTVFAVNTDGTGFTNLHKFISTSDGSIPLAGMILSGSTLYGTTSEGGSFGNGTIFRVNTDGMYFTNLHNFDYTNGAGPWAGLLLSGNTLYGTTSSGGMYGNGTVFSVNIGGTGFTNLYNFTSANNDGALPEAGLIQSGNTLYGTTFAGGSSGWGTLFAVHTDGTDFTILYEFTLSSGGGSSAGLLLCGDNLLGTTSGGGSFTPPYAGTVFALNLSPPLEIAVAGNQAVLSWPAWAPNFSLQSATNLNSVVWTAVSPAPAILNGQNVVSNSISGAQQFYRLGQ